MDYPRCVVYHNTYVDDSSVYCISRYSVSLVYVVIPLGLFGVFSELSRAYVVIPVGLFGVFSVLFVAFVGFPVALFDVFSVLSGAYVGFTVGLFGVFSVHFLQLHPQQSTSR